MSKPLRSIGGIEFHVQYETACNFGVYRTLPGEAAVSPSYSHDGRDTISLPCEVVQESMTARLFHASADVSKKPGARTTVYRCLLPSEYAKYGLVVQP